MTSLLPATATASVALPDGGSELRRLPMSPAGPDSAWLRVAASGICGTDVGLCAGGLAEPTVLGHHVVGELAQVGVDAARRWGLGQGEHVVVEEYLPCGHCDTCAGGWYRLCPETDLWGGGRRIGTIPASEDQGLSGGNAEYLRLPHNAVLHRIPPELSWDLAVWTLPLANALDWVLDAGELREGETVVVLGPGYHGLAAAAAALSSGAGRVVVCGRTGDEERLALAAALGCETVLGIGELPGALRAATADVVLDATGPAADSVGAALDLLGHRGRLVLTTPKNPPVTGLDTRRMTRGMLTVRAVRGRSPRWVTRAIELLASARSGLEAIPTVTVDLAGTGAMLQRLARGEGPATPHVVVRPADHNGTTETERNAQTC
jgi:threonine dehydrogenase-like Zn-dependent dehydrogenase